MLLFNQITQMSRKTIAIIMVLLLSACQFQPLYGDRAAGQAGGLEQVGVASVDSRVAHSTAGTVTVTARYDLVDLKTNETIASGSRDASASYDRTGQVLANNRATRDAENRAAKEAAEALRLAIASHMNRL